MIAKEKIYSAYKVLIHSEPFWSTISQYVAKIPSESIPTACVVFVDGIFRMYYSPEFIDKLTLKETIGLLKHEFMHIAFDHLSSFKADSSEENKLWNIAHDLAINSFIVDEIPKNGCVPGVGKFEEFPLFKDCYWYYNEMLKDKDKYKGSETVDVHLSMSEEELKEVFGDDIPEEVLQACKEWSNLSEKERKAKTSELMRNAAKTSAKQGWGTVPQQLRTEVESYIRSKVSWKEALKYFVNSISSNKRRTTRTKINRRYGLIHPGSVKEYTTKIAVSVDQSGSMCEERLAKVAAELNKLCELVEFVVVPFDTALSEEHIYTWKKNKKQKLIRERCGGTDLSPPIQWVDKQKKFSGHIMFSDLEASEPVRSRTRMLFIGVSTTSPYFKPKGKLVFI